MIFRKKKRATPVEQLQRRVGDVAERVQDTWRHAPEKIEDLKATLRHTPEKMDDLRESAGHLKDSAGEAVARVREAVTQRAAASGTAASEVVKNTTKSAAQTVYAVTQAASQRVHRSHVPEPVIVTDERGSKLLWFAVGLLAGAVLGILLAPNAGRRSRALLKDKAAQGGQKAANLGAAATGKVADLGRRAKGVASELGSRVGDDGAADDTVIADRVRTALGQNPATHGLERLNVTCVDGVVTLHGPIIDEELRSTIEGIVRAVKGVQEVQTALLVEDAPEDNATFVG